MVSTEPCQGSSTGSIPVQDSIFQYHNGLSASAEGGLQRSWILWAGTRIGIAHCLRNNGLWVRIPLGLLLLPWRNWQRTSLLMKGFWVRSPVEGLNSRFRFSPGKWKAWDAIKGLQRLHSSHDYAWMRFINSKASDRN